MRIKNIKNFKNFIALDVSSISDREWESLFAACIKFDALKGFVQDLIRKQIKIDPWFSKSIEYLLFNEGIDYDISKDIGDLDPIDLEDVEAAKVFNYELEVSDLGFKLSITEEVETDGDEKIWVPKEVKLEII